ncbi:MAG: imidazolonepropionase, partial [Flavobacteriales bacterium]
MRILIKNIKGIVQYEPEDEQREMLYGNELSELKVLEDAYIAIDNGVIADVDKMENWPGIEDWRDLEIIDARDRYVFPSWVDSHTHIVFAGSREGEFVDRIKGLSYEEIA